VSNPRKGSYGYTIRILTGIDMNDFENIALRASASSNGGFNLYRSASTLFVGNSTVYSSTEGLTFPSARWVYGQNLTANAFNTADDYSMWIVADSTGEHFISPVVVITVDP